LIEQRSLRDWCSYVSWRSQSGLTELADRFASVETMPAARIGATVIAALSWLQDKPEHSALAGRLEMFAVNLKNLK